MSNIYYCVIVVFIALMVTACKIRIIVPEGGSVRSESGAYYCAESKTCEIDVVDFYFDETFKAEPNNGYRFTVWRKGRRRFCGKDEKNREPCRVHTTGFEKNPDLAEIILSFLESDQAFYLQPIFALKNSCSGLIASTGNQFTLRQGEHTIRDVTVSVNNRGRPMDTAFEGCPTGVCTRSISRTRLWFTPTVFTSPGTYNISYYTYTGGITCSLLGCFSQPVKIQQRWNFEMKVTECPR